MYSGRGSLYGAARRGVVGFVFGVRGFCFERKGEVRLRRHRPPGHGVHDKFEAVRRAAFLAIWFSVVGPLCYSSLCYSSHVP